MLYALANRSLLEVNVLADRNPFFVRLSNGDIRNGYTLKILNKLHEPRTFDIDVEGLKDAKVSIVGYEGDADPAIAVPTDVLKELRVFVAVPGATAATLEVRGEPFSFVVRDIDSGRISKRATKFRRP
jgi:polyferredoxin